MIRDVNVLLRCLADKAPLLIENATSNLAESWMSVRGEFDGGKVINRCARGAWYARCYRSALRVNVGPNWSPLVWEKITGHAADRLFRHQYLKRSVACVKVQTQKSNPIFMARVRNRKMERQRQSATKSARMSYGEQAVSLSKDATPVNRISSMKEFYTKEVVLDENQRRCLEQRKRAQSISDAWHEERRKRLTALNFGEVMSRRKTTPAAPLVR